MSEDGTIPISDIRELLEPEKYLEALHSLQATIRERISGIFAERDLLEKNPEVSDAIKRMEFQNSDKQLRDLKWRYDEADRRIKAKESGTKEAVAPPDTLIPPPPGTFPTPSRAERRRKKES
jgi:hypothetical protein